MRRKTPIEFHLIDIVSGLSHGGFKSLEAARQYAREENLPAWDVWHGHNLVERHDPIAGIPVHTPVAILNNHAGVERTPRYWELMAIERYQLADNSPNGEIRALSLRLADTCELMAKAVAAVIESRKVIAAPPEGIHVSVSQPAGQLPQPSDGGWRDYPASGDLRDGGLYRVGK